MPSKHDRIGIADAIDDLRNQIVEARERGKETRGVKFGLREVEVELQLVAEQTDGAGGKASVFFGVFGGEASYDAEFSTSQVHTIRFKLDVSDEATDEMIALSRGA